MNTLLRMYDWISLNRKTAGIVVGVVVVIAVITWIAQ